MCNKTATAQISQTRYNLASVLVFWGFVYSYFKCQPMLQQSFLSTNSLKERVNLFAIVS